MKSIIGIYESHEKAIEALHTLKNTGFSLTQLAATSKNHINFRRKRMNFQR